MRISDWSSDVCSSDLNYRGEAIGFKSITAYRGSSNHTFYDVDGTPLPITSQEQFDRYRQFSQELQLSSPEDAKALRWVAGLYYFRSEEHTSELQSLMRISYAVFCLKKKNNKNDDKIHR